MDYDFSGAFWAVGFFGALAVTPLIAVGYALGAEWITLSAAAWCVVGLAALVRFVIWGLGE